MELLALLFSRLLFVIVASVFDFSVYEYNLLILQLQILLSEVFLDPGILSQRLRVVHDDARGRQVPPDDVVLEPRAAGDLDVD